MSEAEFESEAGNYVGSEGNVMIKRDRFNHIQVQSLSRIATVSLITTIYKQSKEDIVEILESEYKLKAFTDTTTLLKQKLLLLPQLPQSIVEDSLDVCKQVALEGFHTLELTLTSSDRKTNCNCGFHFCIPIEYFDCISFTMNGTVDHIKTFSLLHEQNYPAYKIFIAASHLCSQELVAQSWEELLTDFNACSCGLSVYECLRNMYEFKDCLLTKYWAHLMNSLNNGVDVQGVRILGVGPYENYRMLEFSLRCANSYLVSYVFQMLPGEEKSSMAEMFADEAFENVSCYASSDLFKRSLRDLNIALFLLSNVNESELQIEILVKHLSNLILPLVSNPVYQKLLKPVINLVCHSFDKSNFNLTCQSILRLTLEGSCIAKKLFFKLWNECGKSYKKSYFHYLCVHHGDWRSGMLKFTNFSLFTPECLDILKLLLSERTDDEKRNYVYSSAILRLRYFIQEINSMSFIDNMINEIFSSEVEIIRFKKFIVSNNSIRMIIYVLITRKDCDSANKLLDWVFTSQNEIENYKRDLNFVLGFISDKKYSFHIIQRGRYDLLEGLLNWCFNFEPEMVKEFKKTLPFVSYERLYFIKWDFFLQFVHWCFDNEEEDVKSFKNFMSQFEKLVRHMWHRIGKGHFEYVNNMLNWCLSSKKIKKFKITRFKFKCLANMLEIMVCETLLGSQLDEFPRSLETAEKLATWYGLVGLKRIRKLEKLTRRTKLRLENGYDTRVLDVYNGDDMQKIPNSVIKLLNDLIVSLESLHKSQISL